MSGIELSREELYELVWTKPMTHLAPGLGISDRGLGKTCTRLEIPVPGRGYWQKIATGQQVEREPLEPLSETCQSFAWFHGPYKKPEPIILPEADMVKKAQAFEAKPENQIIVPLTIHRYQPLVKRTLDSLLSSGWGKQGLFESRGEEVLDLSCTKECAPRAAKIYQTVIQSLKQRGFSLSDRSNYINCYEEQVKFSIREKLERIPYKRPKGKAPSIFGDPKFVFIPSGKLKLKIGERYDSRNQCIDEPGNPLEEQLNEFMIKLAKEALSIKQDRAEQERRERKWEAKRQEQEKIKQQAALEKMRRDDLDELVASWIKSKQTRQFIETLCPLLLQSPYDDMSKEEWLTWASNYADELDPLSS